MQIVRCRMIIVAPKLFSFKGKNAAFDERGFGPEKSDYHYEYQRRNDF